MFTLNKISNWSLKDIYRLPIAIVLSLLIMRNYSLRKKGLLPDKWYWADSVILKWGYVVS
jgi:hypothetical protein